MQTAADYLASTESAVKHLFAGIEQYMVVLKQVVGPMFITSTPPGPEQDAEFEHWLESNTSAFDAARKAQQRFMAEAFALDTLCGAVLHVAEKALEVYSRHTTVPGHLPPEIGAKRARYCIGRTIRTVPLGLVIYAGRNQHAHFNEGVLNPPSTAVFNLLATAHGYNRDGERVTDPAFDLANPGLMSYASNVTALIGWRSYEAYIKDMRDMLGVPPGGN